jgi:hypothetical protein
VYGSNELIGEALADAARRGLLHWRRGRGRAQHWFAVRGALGDGPVARPPTPGSTR